MTSARQHRTANRVNTHFYDDLDAFQGGDGWVTTILNSSGYDYEDELVDQLAKLPDSEDIDELMSTLRTSTLRHLSSEVINGTIDAILANADRLERAKFINSWIATAEETVAAGRNFSRIAARRK